MITETVYRGRDNEFSLELEANGSAQDISALTRATLEFADEKFDSNIDSTYFDWTTSGSSGQLDVDIGTSNKLKNIDPGTYRAKLTIYDATYPNGLVWGHFMLKVV